MRGSVLLRVPTAAERTGDFSVLAAAVGQNIFDPATTVVERMDSLSADSNFRERHSHQSFVTACAESSPIHPLTQYLWRWGHGP